MSTLGRAAAGTLAAALVAAGARRLDALSEDGAVAATLVGGAVVAGSGVRGGAALVAFFASSSLLGRLPRDKERVEQRRGNARDAVQVLANGGAGALLALAAAAAPATLASSLQAAYGGAIAAAAADTWATEIGSRWGGTPRSIATLDPVPPGASGGVTPVGLAASLAGAASVALVLERSRLRDARDRVVATIVGGLAGSLADSLLGATLQEARWCALCQEETETLVHRCGTATRHRRGHSWCTNDTVNALATALGALVALTVWSSTHRATRSRQGLSDSPIPKRKRRSWRPVFRSVRSGDGVRGLRNLNSP